MAACATSTSMINSPVTIRDCWCQWLARKMRSLTPQRLSVLSAITGASLVFLAAITEIRLVFLCSLRISSGHFAGLAVLHLLFSELPYSCSDALTCLFSAAT
jgi:hypothetical protein